MARPMSFSSSSTSSSPSEESLYERATRERREGRRLNSIGYYDFERSIGEGNFAKVKLATHALTGAKVAVKIVDKSKVSLSAVEKLVREVRILKSLNHPYITRLYEVIDTPQEVFLIMEYAEGGELFDYLVAHGRMKEKDARRYFRQIISAVDYCHKRYVIHRDLKAENLLLDLNMNPKIADFGFSNNFEDGKPLSTWCGSPPYAAPELFQGKEYFGPEVDIWSLGVVLYVLVCGALPFEGASLAAVRQRVLSGKFRVPFSMSQDCEHLINRMLTLDPAQRITLEGIKCDKWFNEGFEPLGDATEAEIVITPQQHATIMARMETIGIPRFAVERALETQTFDNIWATYFLIADQISPRNLPESFALRPLPFSQAQLTSTALSFTRPETPRHVDDRRVPAAAAAHAAAVPDAAPSSQAQPTTPPKERGSQKDSAPASSEEARSSSPPAADQEKAKKARRHTVNTQLDVVQLRKDMAAKRAITKIDTSVAGSGPTSPVDSPASSVPASPIYSIPEENVAPVGPPGYQLPLTEFSSPIPRKKKDRRERAISLQRPSSMYATPASVSTGTPFSGSARVPSTQSEEDAAAGVSSSSVNPRTSPASSLTVKTLRLQGPSRLISFKDKFKRSFGLLVKEQAEPVQVQPKTLRFHFSVSTTSAKSATDLVAEVERVMADFQVPHERENFLFLANKDNVAFEDEALIFLLFLVLLFSPPAVLLVNLLTFTLCFFFFFLSFFVLTVHKQ